MLPDVSVLTPRLAKELLKLKRFQNLADAGNIHHKTVFAKKRGKCWNGSFSLAGAGKGREGRGGEGWGGAAMGGAGVAPRPEARLSKAGVAPWLREG